MNALYRLTLSNSFRCGCIQRFARHCPGVAKLFEQATGLLKVSLARQVSTPLINGSEPVSDGVVKVQSLDESAQRLG
jgi:hypothetical protein